VAKGKLGDLTVDQHGRPVVAYSTMEGIFIVTGAGALRHQEKVTGAGTKPVLEFDRQGRLHMAYSLQKEVPFFVDRVAINPQIAYTVRTGPCWRKPRIVAHGISFFHRSRLRRIAR